MGSLIFIMCKPTGKMLKKCVAVLRLDCAKPWNTGMTCEANRHSGELGTHHINI